MTFMIKSLVLSSSLSIREGYVHYQVKAKKFCSKFPCILIKKFGKTTLGFCFGV